MGFESRLLWWAYFFSSALYAGLDTTFIILSKSIEGGALDESARQSSATTTFYLKSSAFNSSGVFDCSQNQNEVILEMNDSPPTGLSECCWSRVTPAYNRGPNKKDRHCRIQTICRSPKELSQAFIQKGGDLMPPGCSYSWLNILKSWGEKTFEAAPESFCDGQLEISPFQAQDFSCAQTEWYYALAGYTQEVTPSPISQGSKSRGGFGSLSCYKTMDELTEGDDDTARVANDLGIGLCTYPMTVASLRKKQGIDESELQLDSESDRYSGDKSNSPALGGGASSSGQPSSHQ